MSQKTRYCPTKLSGQNCYSLLRAEGTFLDQNKANLMLFHRNEKFFFRSTIEGHGPMNLLDSRNVIQNIPVMLLEAILSR